VALRRTYYTILKETLQKNPITGEEEQFYKPTDEQVVNKSQCYDKITETGFPKLGTLVGANDVVISSTQPREEGRDASYALRTNEHGTVDIIAGPRPQHRQATATLARSAYGAPGPQIGDKLSSRSGQKGTIGMLVPAHDMPSPPTESSSSSTRTPTQSV
jgi:DNA-directed RNA polymerase beta subunit